MKTVLKLIEKEYRLFFSDRVAVAFTFIIPIVLIMIWGAVFGRLDSGPERLRLAFVNQSSAEIAHKIESVLDTSKTFRLVRSYTDENGRKIVFDTTSVQDYVRKGNVSAALVIPEDAYTDTSFGLKMRFYYDPKNQMEMQVIQGVLQQTIMTRIPSLFMQGMRGQALLYLGRDSARSLNRDIASVFGKYFGIDTKRITDFSFSDTSFSSTEFQTGARKVFQNMLQLEEIQLVGKEITNPWATRSVGGWAMMFLLFTLTASSLSMFDEKKSGVVLRILASPISRVQILWSKYLYNMSLGFIQLAVLFGAGAVLYKIDIFSNIVNLSLVIVAASIACTAFGMLLAAVSRTPAQANGLGTLLILAMSSVGGAWFPTSFMPDFIQTISKTTLVYWSMDGFLKVLWRSAGVLEIAPNLGILLAMAAAITTVSVWQFRKGHMF